MSESVSFQSLTLQSFDALIDAIESPRARIKRVVRAIAATELHDVPQPVAQTLLSAATTQLAQRVAEAIESGHFDQIGALLTQFSIDLRASVARERREGSLRAPTDGLSERLEILRSHGWGGIEIAQLRVLLRPGESLVGVDYFLLQTSERVISRDEIRTDTRPLSWTNRASWERQFRTDREVEDLRSEARQREQNERAPWADNYNRDIPRNRVISD